MRGMRAVVVDRFMPLSELRVREVSEPTITGNRVAGWAAGCTSTP